MNLLLPPVPAGYEGFEFAITEDMVNQLTNRFPNSDISIGNLIKLEQYCSQNNYPTSPERAIYIRNKKIDIILDL